MRALSHLTIVVIFVLSVSLPNTTTAQQNNLISILLNKAKISTKAFEYDSAITSLNKVLLLCKSGNYKNEEVTAYDLLSEIHQTNGKLEAMRKYDSIAIPLITKLKDSTLLMNAYNRLGIYNMERGNNKEAEQNFKTILSLGLEKKANTKTAEVYSNLGSLYLALGEKNKASEQFFKSLALYEKNNNDAGIGETYSNISSVFYLNGKTDDAIKYQKKSIEIREKINDKKGLIVTNTNIGQLYILTGNNSLALPHLQRAVSLAEQMNNAKLKAASYSAMAVYNSRVKNFPEALVWQTKAISGFEEIDDKQMLSRLYVSAANLSNATNDSLKAVSFFDKALKLAIRLGNKENVGNVYDKMSSFYLSHKDYEKAHVTYQKYINYKDSIAEKSSDAKIEEIKTRYETEKKDNEINKLSTLKKLNQLQLEKQEALITGNIQEAKNKQAEIELLSKESELKEFKLAQQNEVLEKQALYTKTKEQELLINIKEKKLADREIENQKIIKNLLFAGLASLVLLGFVLFNRFKLKRKIEEQAALLKIRNGISQNLHDEIGSTLTSINILSNISQQAIDKEPSQAKEMIIKIANQSKTIQQNISDIVWSIRPDTDNIESLYTRMREFASQTLEPLEITFTINTDKTVQEKNIPMAARRELLLIYKEAINNIVKHSGAKIVDIKFTCNNKQLCMSISDNGVWKGDSSGTGTKSMKQRAASLGGSFNINNDNNNTEVVTIIPIT